MPEITDDGVIEDEEEIIPEIIDLGGGDIAYHYTPEQRRRLLERSARKAERRFHFTPGQIRWLNRIRAGEVPTTRSGRKRQREFDRAMEARRLGKPLPCTCWEEPIPSGMVYHTCARCKVARIFSDDAGKKVHFTPGQARMLARLQDDWREGEE